MHWRRFIQQTDHLWLTHWPVIISIVLLIGLRLPNFTEPYWYGDEGIYLTIGQSLRAGERLYSEIIDHKTPLIYYLAMVPSQLAFRWLLLGWMIAATVAVYALSRRIWSNRLSEFATVLSFVVLTTLPRLEGNIPNGELFVMGFIVVGLYLLFRTQWWNRLLNLDSRDHITHPVLYLVAGGVVLSLGILTKVPALFDVLSVGWLAWLAAVAVLISTRLSLQQKVQTLFKELRPGIWVAVGVIAPIMLSVLYFVLRGSGQAYLDFGLLYNFRYAGSWSLPFTSPIVVWLFSLPGKAVVMATLLLALTIAQVWLTRKWSWLLGWFVLSIFASLLSNRPYPHYFLQVIPPLALVIGGILEAAVTFFTERTSKKRVISTLHVVSAGTFIAFFLVIWNTLGVWKYPTLSYYQNWTALLLGSISPEEYRTRFNPLMADNYRVTPYLQADPNPYLFIWGTNPTLYAQSGKIPTGRFTVSFHIKDFQAYDETFADFVNRQPTHVIVMNDESTSWPELMAYLQQWYLPDTSYTYFTLWRRMAPPEQL